MNGDEIPYIRDRDCTRNTPVVLGLPETPIYGTGKRIRPRYSGKCETTYDKAIFLPELLPLEEYHLIVVCFSAGKDSMGAYWKLRELGVPKERIEIWHHDVDGTNPDRFMDWPVTQAYCQAFAEAEGVRLRRSWRVNGFFGELYRIGASYPIEYEDDGEIKTCRLSKKQQRSDELRSLILQGWQANEELSQHGLRMKFPAKSADLARRWCSAYLKISVADSVLCNLEALKELGKVERFPFKGSIGAGRWCSPQLKREVSDSVIRNLDELQGLGSPRHKFPAKSDPHQGRWCSGSLKAQVQDSVTSNLDQIKQDAKILIVTGERRGESSGRARYREMEIHRANATAKAHRLVHHWRAVIDHSERDIWEILKRYNISPHPCYLIGWGRCSCASCIFSLPRHWAGIRELFPERYEALKHDEIVLGFTIDNKKSLDEFVGDARSCVVHTNEKAIWQTKTGIFTASDVFTKPGDWDFPAGAFSGSDGGPC